MSTPDKSWTGSRLRLALLAVVVLAAGCATVPPEEDPVIIKLTELDGRLERVERVLDNQSLLDMLSRLQAMQSEMAELRNQVETLRFESEGAGKRQRDLYVDLDERLNALQGRVSTVNLDSAAAEAGGQGSSGAGGFDNDRAAYQKAFELLEEGRYEEAQNAFRGFLDTYKNSALADNAQYWLAEALYVQRLYPEAIREFGKVVAGYPDSRKVADALLKTGFGHYELAKYPEARSVLERVVAEHADTTAARLASQRLDRMRGEGR